MSDVLSCERVEGGGVCGVRRLYCKVGAGGLLGYIGK